MSDSLAKTSVPWQRRRRLEYALNWPDARVGCSRAREFSLKTAQNNTDGGWKATEPLEPKGSKRYLGPSAVRARANWEMSDQYF